MLCRVKLCSCACRLHWQASPSVQPVRTERDMVVLLTSLPARAAAASVRLLLQHLQALQGGTLHARHLLCQTLQTECTATGVCGMASSWIQILVLGDVEKPGVARNVNNIVDNIVITKPTCRNSWSASDRLMLTQLATDIASNHSQASSTCGGSWLAHMHLQAINL